MTRYTEKATPNRVFGGGYTQLQPHFVCLVWPFVLQSGPCGRIFKFNNTILTNYCISFCFVWPSLYHSHNEERSLLCYVWPIYIVYGKSILYRLVHVAEALSQKNGVNLH